MRDDNDLSKPEDSVELDQVDTDPRNDVSPPRKLRDATGQNPKAKAVEVLGRSHSNGIVGMSFCSFKREVALWTTGPNAERAERLLW